MICALLLLIVSPGEKSIGLILAIAGCVLAGSVCASYLNTVLSFLRELQELGELQADMLKILLQAVGIGIVSEIASLICTDSGSASLGKMLQYLGCFVILWLSIPALRTLLDLVQGILGGI